MALMEEYPLQRLLQAFGPKPGSIMPGPEGQPLTVEPPPAPSGPSQGPTPGGELFPPGQPHWGDIQDLEGGAAFNRNTPFTIPPAPSVGLLPHGPLAQAGGDLLVPKTPGVTREQLESAGSQGLLPWDFFAKTPEFAGGVLKTGNEFTRWDLARHLENPFPGVSFNIPKMNREEMIAALTPQPGQPGLANAGTMNDDQLRAALDRKGINYFKMSDLDMTNALRQIKPELFKKMYSLIEPKQDTSLQTQINGLITGWTDKISDALTRGDTNAAYSYGKSLKDIMSQLPPLMTAQAGVAKTPAEIENLKAQAKREQIVTGVPTGQIPGEVTAYRAAPGQAPNPFATGIGPTGGHSEQIMATLMTNAMNKNSDRKSRALLANPNYMVDPQGAMTQLKPLFDQWDEEMRQEINGIPAIMKATSGGVVPPQGAAPGRKMTWAEYYTKSKALGHPDANILREGAVLLQQGKIIR
ncbi:MAG: hypothetical protein NTV04_20095 [Deltaproteobacteria bacterium]|nr:hypothetical protein [Deltaproteobacteria bacterium]